MNTIYYYLTNFDPSYLICIDYFYFYLLFFCFSRIYRVIAIPSRISLIWSGCRFYLMLHFWNMSAISYSSTSFSVLLLSMKSIVPILLIFFLLSCDFSIIVSFPSSVLRSMFSLLFKYSINRLKSSKYSAISPHNYFISASYINTFLLS